MFLFSSKKWSNTVQIMVKTISPLWNVYKLLLHWKWWNDIATYPAYDFSVFGTNKFMLSACLGRQNIWSHKQWQHSIFTCILKTEQDHTRMVYSCFFLLYSFRLCFAFHALDSHTIHSPNVNKMAMRYRQLAHRQHRRMSHCEFIIMIIHSAVVVCAARQEARRNGKREASFNQTMFIQLNRNFCHSHRWFVT